VVASPPVASLAPGSDYSLRIVRLNKTPVAGEEDYRVLVDELPQPEVARIGGMIHLLLRYSIPVFFLGETMAPPRVEWSISDHGGKLVVTAHNEGDRHLRLSNMQIRDARGRQVSFGSGLAGYVLGRSTMRFTAPGRSGGFGTGVAASLTAQSDLGPIDVKADLRN
jgi:fimbrial chaperone protein